MTKRLQRINGDTVLEITEQQPVKRRLSENHLLRRKKYYQDAIAKFQVGLDEVSAQLNTIYEEKNRA